MLQKKLSLAAAIVAVTLAPYSAAAGQSFGGLRIGLPKLPITLPGKIPSKLPGTEVPAKPAIGTEFGPSYAERAAQDNASPKVKEITFAAEKAERIVHYGLDNELPDKSDVKMARFLMAGIQKCLDGISELRNSAPQTRLWLNGYDPLSLTEVENRFCKPAIAQLEPVAGQAVRDYEARWAGLSTSRRQLVEAHGLDAYTVYGHGKRVLSSPAALQASDVWYVWDEEKGYLTPHWWMATIRWSGDNYTKTVVKGAGSAPAVGLFR